MTWETRYQSGSFRGVPFETRNHALSGGRRNIVHEYPLRDVPYVQDLGLKARKYQMSLYVLGNDYMDHRDALISALEQEGPGNLIHPYYGEKLVCVNGEYSVTESTEEGGICRISVTFVDAGENLFPAGKAATPKVVEAEANAMRISADTDFTKVFSVKSLPTIVEQLASNKIVETLSNTFHHLTSESGVQQIVLSATQQQMRDIETNIVSLVRDPETLTASLSNVWHSADNLHITQQEQVTIANRVIRMAQREREPIDDFNNTDNNELLRSKVDQQIESNQQAIDQLFSAYRIRMAANAIAHAEFDHAAAAQNAVDTLIAEMDWLMLSAHDALFAALRNMRVAIREDLANRLAYLPQLSQVQLPKTLPAVAAVHYLYGSYDIDKENDLIARNPVNHPGFVAGGQPLEVRVYA